MVKRYGQKNNQTANLKNRAAVLLAIDSQTKKSAMFSRVSLCMWFAKENDYVPIK